jgi:molecular chaperone GrpE (heat shock protein)
MEHEPQTDWREPMNDNRSDDEFGAIDIVEAFTALRHDLKLQIRSGTETQQLLNQRLDKLERLAQNASAVPTEIPDSEARKLALALVEIEDALQRAVDGLQQSSNFNSSDEKNLTSHQLKLEIDGAGWLIRKTAGGLLQRLRGLADKLEQSQAASEDRIGLARQGLELLLERTRRLMRERQIERRDVNGLAFDSGLMNAIEAVSTTSVQPGHVAEQLKPAYLWRKQVLCFAEVRVASTHS